MASNMAECGTQICPDGATNVTPSTAEGNVLAKKFAALVDHRVEEAPPHVILHAPALICAIDPTVHVGICLAQLVKDTAFDQHAAGWPSIDFNKGPTLVERLADCLWLRVEHIVKAIPQPRKTAPPQHSFLHLLLVQVLCRIWCKGDIHVFSK
eukprot:CAMPEP_0172865408 /NCGR_PEP_ID=MMETSP1075-20121228/81389_1 /TAXON_ID=2916 /ORGANISM="Ceratium fusus, Strain PA161109" /LENGTH=152 /DNA_ID=CAMNT_0013714435 /DNA_START=75 /DNA_END=533 /DNA_ORIENTATION=+